MEEDVISYRIILRKRWEEEALDRDCDELGLGGSGPVVRQIME